MNKWSIILLEIMSFLVNTDGGFYIPKQEYKFYIGNTLKTNDTIGVIHVFQHGCIECTSDDIISEHKDVIATLESSRINFRVSPGVKELTNSGHTVSFLLRINCRPPETFLLFEYYKPLMSAKIILINDSSTNSFTSSTWKNNAFESNGTHTGSSHRHCFRHGTLFYNIIENTVPGIIDVFGNRYNVKLNLNQDDYIFLNSSTGQLHLIKSPDQEQVDKITVTLICKVRNSFSDSWSKSLNVIIYVYDVDDNPPFTHINKTIQIVNESKSNFKSVIELITYDYDNETVTRQTYTISTNDTLNIIKIASFTTQSVTTSVFNGTQIKTVVNVEPQNLPEPYTVEVTVADLCYVPVNNNGLYFNNKVIHRIVIPANLNVTAYVQETLTPTILKVQLDRAAAKYSLVTQVRKKHNLSTFVNKTNFMIDWVNPATDNKLLAVTSAGDVYITSDVKLFSVDHLMPIRVGITGTINGDVMEKYELVIHVTNRVLSKPEKCVHGCACYNTYEKCLASCGIGASSGRCQWRHGNVTMSTFYSTCSHDIDTCPDGFCSELENMDKFLCPQDCLTGKVNGQGTKRNNGTGISAGKGTCWCENELTAGELYCQCGMPMTLATNRSKIPNHTPGSKLQEKADTLIINTDDNESCSTLCKATIGGFLTAVFALVMITVVALMVWRRRRRRQTAAIKHVGSIVSMNAVQSDYVVDDGYDHRGQFNRQTSSPASGRWTGKTVVAQDLVDDKWEFPRQYLTLEHVIGEGEFGQVVRAQAFMLKGQEGNTVVAVKMLKPDASGADYQDLVSEIQLLKEVSHPNVIELFGVCTQKGPLYAIVEYCELGSLRTFLRSSKFRNKNSWENRMRMEHDDTLANCAEPINLTCRDLFSFAWQIAKGMDYLASLKVVHRDLAARNILVTESLKIKISDFGLSRDVYEADTYLKMSKGRIPVKWMAPESLYAQVYTTKSDM